MDVLSVWPATEWMVVDPIWFVVNHGPPVLTGEVPETMVEIWQRI